MRTLAGLGMLAVAVSAGAQMSMTPDHVKEAVAVGKAIKGDNTGSVMNDYILRDGDWVCGHFTTPYLRVALRAESAARAYREPTPAEIAEAAKPSIEVHAEAKVGNDVRNVVAVVVASDDSDAATITKPISSESQSSVYSNAFGANQQTGTSMHVRFPLSIIRTGNQFRFAYSDAPECRVPIRGTVR